jgi:hypothetical protein
MPVITAAHCCKGQERRFRRVKLHTETAKATKNPQAIEGTFTVTSSLRLTQPLCERVISRSQFGVVTRMIAGFHNCGDHGRVQLRFVLEPVENPAVIFTL